MSLNRYTFMSIVCCLVAVACNYTEPGTCSLGQGGSGPVVGQGGSVILPPQGGFGDTPPDPQGADGAADPCNAVEGKILYCNGDIICHNNSGPGATGCHHANTTSTKSSEGAAIEWLVNECRDLHPGYSCGPGDLTCGDKPKTIAKPSYYICNGGVICMDAKNQSDGCTFISEEVYADDDAEARDLLVENCEIDMHDKYKNNCDHGGMCCKAGSLTCNKK